MITTHPNPLPIWDELPEKMVQQAIFSRLNPQRWIREHPIGVGYVDLLGSQYVVELKRSTGSNPTYATLGQILYYRSGLEISGYYRHAVIMLYGSSIDRYLDPVLTDLRQRLGVRLWVIVSLAEGLIADVDTGDLFPLTELDTPVQIDPEATLISQSMRMAEWKIP